MKKILSLLTLLIVAIGTSWAAEVTLVSTNFTTWKTGATPPENTGLSNSNTYTLTDGTNDVASVVGKGCKMNDTKNTPTATGITGYTEKWFRFGSSNNYLTITPSGKFYNGGKVRALISSNSLNCTNGTVTVGSTGIGTITTAAAADGGDTDCHWIEFDIPSTVNNQTASITFTRTSTTFFIWGVEIITNSQASEAFTVSFDAGDHGTYTGGDITEESAGAGITLPALTTLEDGYAFQGWFSAATGGEKAGEAGEAYVPTADVTLYAQYVAESAPTISVDQTSVSTYTDVAVTFTATADGAPEPTVTWYQNETASTTGGTSVGTGLTYQPDVTAEGTYYYYAVASNGVSPDATSELITLDVEAPVTVYDATGLTNSEFILSHTNISTYAFVTNSKENWSTMSPAGYPSTEYINMSSTDRNIKIKVTGADNFRIVVLGGGGERSCNVTIGSGSATEVPVAQNTLITSDLFEIADASAETTITIAGTGSSVYPVAIQFNIPTTETITIPSEGVLTYVTENALDFSSQNGAFTAYVPTGVNAAKTKVNTAEVTTVPAGTALLLKGAAGTYNVTIVASAEEPEANIFQVSNGSVTGGDNIFAYSKSALKFKKVADTVTIPSGKCYLQIDGVSGDALDLDFEGEATAVDAIAEADEAEAAPVKVIKNGKLYIGNFNVAGQQVK